MNRLECLKEGLKNKFDSILITSEINQLYLSSFSFTDGYVLITKNKSYVLTDFRYIEAAKAEVKGDFEILTLQGKRSDFIGKLLAENEVKTLGYEDNFLPCANFEDLKREFPTIEFLPIGNLIDSLREFKSIDEINIIKSAQNIADAAFDHIIKRLNPNMTEIEVALELEFFMRKNGANNTSFDIIAVSGVASSLPHGVPRNVTLEKGFLTLDFGALYNGYCSDMTRTIVIGKADNEMKKIYQTVLSAQLAAIEMMNVDVKCSEVDKVARNIIDDAGYKNCFGHGLGHGVGMFIHEAPRLSPTAANTTLKNGHVVTVEPGIYIQNKYGVRIEDMIVFSNNNAENITHSPKELIELF